MRAALKIQILFLTTFPPSVIFSSHTPVALLCNILPPSPRPSVLTSHFCFAVKTFNCNSLSCNNRGLLLFVGVRGRQSFLLRQRRRLTPGRTTSTTKLSFTLVSALEVLWIFYSFCNAFLSRYFIYFILL